ncbi:YeaH/YhbH family protein [Rhizorhapis suberifaciens]|uniref:UPF0229 protein HNQ99_002232 n=1 Tax=Rhizorhapis suberifaciens TaxID=13656 RepID=A0A840HWX8_9SPHN|nr:YeaH/YhbH family protein [Rhizorhapis suberifaciens]MBB4641914.1 hypothetical protein [Rhizorhapis suberifaciens]
MYVIDRRLNPGGKSLVNRQRFLRRARSLVQRAVRDSLKGRSIKDIDQEGEVSIVRKGVHEPSLHRTQSGGNRDHIFPGNKEYIEGDKIPRPPGGSGQGSGGSEAGTGEGEDEFRFVLTREEFLDLFLDDLELPDLAKRRLIGGTSFELRRAGFQTTGSPATLSIGRTMRNAMSRRIALKRPKSEDLKALEEEIARLEELGDTDADLLLKLIEERNLLERRRKLISYIDPIDLRYRRYEHHPKPIAQAVMFCLMDVSGSMSEHMKDLAKRFYALLHLFLTRCYRHVEVVFIRHTDRAEEVDEETFFYSRETGGTLVSSALDKMMEVVKDRYNPEDWNIYVAQASDGDNMSSDNPKTVSLMQNEIIPISQYVAYLEVGREEDPMAGGTLSSGSELWQAYERVESPPERFVMRKVHHRREIYPVFRELFQKRGVGAKTT